MVLLKISLSHSLLNSHGSCAFCGASPCQSAVRGPCVVRLLEFFTNYISTPPARRGGGRARPRCGSRKRRPEQCTCSLCMGAWRHAHGTTALATAFRCARSRSSGPLWVCFFSPPALDVRLLITAHSKCSKCCPRGIRKLRRRAKRRSWRNLGRSACRSQPAPACSGQYRHGKYGAWPDG